MPKAIKAIDFFCGAGGLTCGLLDAGVDVAAGVDSDPRLRETYERNNKPSRFIAEDIKDVRIDALREELSAAPSGAVLYAACAPCQPFSTLSAMRGEDGRKSLLLDFRRDRRRQSAGLHHRGERAGAEQRQRGRDIQEVQSRAGSGGLSHRRRYA